MNAKKIYLRNFGCQMNDYDSARIIDLMREHGYERTAQPEDADLLVVVTCSIREKAQEKTFSDLGRLRELKKEKPSMRIAVGGCVASQEGKRILSFHVRLGLTWSLVPRRCIACLSFLLNENVQANLR